jgi:hypothetical protein
MHKRPRTTSIFLSLIFSVVIFGATASPAFAQCYDFNTPPTVGAYLLCAMPNLWGFFQTVFIAIAIIFTIFLIYKSVTSRENVKELETLPQRWMFLILFALLAFGAGGTLINILLKFLGFPTVQQWFDVLNNLFTDWDARVK